MLDVTTLDQSEFADLRDTLDGAGLPSSDIDSVEGKFFRISDGERTAFGGLEGRGRELIIRSIVVGEGCRGAGFGNNVVAALEKEARSMGARRLHLLTNTAANFFRRLGYVDRARADAPASISACSQFRDLCPASADYLVKDLGEAS